MADSFDVTEVRRLTADLENAARTVERPVRDVVSRGALNIKRQMVAEMGSSPSFKGTARSISYDMRGNRYYTEALIGPKVGPGESGGLASIAYYGSSTGGGTVADPQGALAAETPRFEAALLALLGDMIR